MHYWKPASFQCDLSILASIVENFTGVWFDCASFWCWSDSPCYFHKRSSELEFTGRPRGEGGDRQILIWPLRQPPPHCHESHSLQAWDIHPFAHHLPTQACSTHYTTEYAPRCGYALMTFTSNSAASQTIGSREDSVSKKQQIKSDGAELTIYSSSSFEHRHF